MNNLKELEKQRVEIMNKMSEIQDSREAELIPLYTKKFVGKCYKYKNSYGRDSKSWWLYAKITKVNSVNFRNDEEPMFDTIQIQKTSNNEISIEAKNYGYIREPDWIEITEKEFNTASRNIMKKANELLEQNVSAHI